MLDFETHISIEEILRSKNLVDKLDEQECRSLGMWVCEKYKQDKDSRSAWEERMKKAMEMALQISDRKTFPWEGAANVKLPLIATAALQYQSRVYPALIDGPSPVAVKPAVVGDKPAEDRAKRIQAHMSYQVLDEMGDWEEETDKGFLIQAIMGCVFKKTWFDPARGINRSICVSPANLVINYWATSVEDSQRVTHVLYMSHNAVRELQMIGVYSEFDSGYAITSNPTLLDYQGKDKRTGMNTPPTDRDTPYEILEMCLYLDLDGDNYREPYMVTVRHDTNQVLRVSPLFTRLDISWTSGKSPRILRIAPCGLYTKYTFIPSPDGGIYDLGLGALLGPVSEVIDSSINQMLDAGTLANAGGGFLGKGAKMKKGDIHQSPGKWTTLDCVGAALRDNVISLPVPQPSEALFGLVKLLIEWGQNLIGATDALLGNNPGQNTPATTMQTMVEQGMKTFNGIYKRTHKAMGREFRKLFRLNVNFLADGQTKFLDNLANSASIFSADYKTDGINLIRPSANPFYMSDMQRMQQAQAIMQTAMTAPYGDKYQAILYFYEAWKVENPSRFVVDPALIMADQQAQQQGKPLSGKVPPGATPQQAPQMLVAQAKQQANQIKQKEIEGNLQMKQAELEMKKAKLQYEIALLSAQAAQAMAQAKGVDVGHQIALMEAQIAAKKNHLDHIIDTMGVHQGVLDSLIGAADADAQRGHERTMATVAGQRGDEAGN